MKKIIMASIIGGLMSLLTACTQLSGRFDISSVKLQEEADLICETIIESFDLNNSEKIKKLFSEKTVKEATDLDDGISENLILYKNSDFTYECLGNSIEEHFEKSNNSCKITGTYKITDREENKFLLWFVYWSVNEQNPDEEGVSLIVLTDYTGIERNLKLEEILGYEKKGIYWSGWDESRDLSKTDL